MRDEFMITRQGKQYVLYKGLLDKAHARGLRGIDTELVQVPTAENGNVALVKVVVEIEAVEGGADSEGSRTFSGIGDASSENVGRNIVPHIIPMAETRVKARALRVSNLTTVRKIPPYIRTTLEFISIILECRSPMRIVRSRHARHAL